MSDDLIKREDAIKAMEQRYQDILRIFKRKVKDGEKAIALDMIGCIKSLPSADRPQGKWIAQGDCGVTKCNRCGWSIEECIDYNYCPNCGAKMRGADDEHTV